MHEECLICAAPLEYLKDEIPMECAICHKTYPSNARCVNGHYVCDSCHQKGLDQIFGLCLKSSDTDPVKIYRKIVSLPFCHMHGPEHHTIVGACLLTAYKNAGGQIDLANALWKMQTRGQQIPGGVCGFWGACGAALSSGIFLSIITDSTPLSSKEWALSNGMTAASLTEISAVGGPRCCKRNSYIAITQAVSYVKEHLGIEMSLSPIVCGHFQKNNQCLKERCPFYPGTK